MNTLEDLRKKIDRLDMQLLTVLQERMRVVVDVGKLKALHNIPPLDAKRWQSVLESRLLQAEAFGLHKEFITRILDTIHDEALRIEKNIL